MPRHGREVVLISQSSGVPSARDAQAVGRREVPSIGCRVEQQRRRLDAVRAPHPLGDHGLARTPVIGEPAAAESAAGAVQLLPCGGAHRRARRELRGIRGGDALRARPQPRDAIARVGDDAQFVRMPHRRRGDADHRRRALEVEEGEGRIGHVFERTRRRPHPSGAHAARSRRRRGELSAPRGRRCPRATARGGSRACPRRARPRSRRRRTARSRGARSPAASSACRPPRARPR